MVLAVAWGESYVAKSKSVEEHKIRLELLPIIAASMMDVMADIRVDEWSQVATL